MPDLIPLTADIVIAFVENNSVPASELPGLITLTHHALARLGSEAEAEEDSAEFPPAVSVRKSLASRDALISMIDGKPYKILKRHLTGNGLTPAEYRARYHLPEDYPMVAPAYAEARRDLAVRIGLGKKTGRARGKRKPA